MKTVKNLYPRIVTYENLYHSFHAASRGKRHQPAVAAFEFNMELNLVALSRELRRQTYRPGPYTSFIIHEPKRRLISAAPFRDRVVHHALYRVMEPIWEARFIDHNYACRLGKGTHRALNQAHAWVRRYRFVLHGDIVKFFPAIDYQILRDLLARRTADGETMWLIDTILQGSAGLMAGESPRVFFPGDDLFALSRSRGLPIGNLTSQLWANVYLHELDMFVKHQLRCSPYLRYMDDFLLFSDDKNQLQEWRTAIADFLASRLRLLLHPRKSLVAPTRIGLDFCGFRLFPTHRRLRRSSVRRFVSRFRRQRLAYRRGELDLQSMHHSVRSWIAHAAHGNTWRLRRRIFNDYPIPSPERLVSPDNTPSHAWLWLPWVG